MSTSVLQSTLFFLIPLFSIALLVLILSHTSGPLNTQAILAYTYIASVTLLATIAGALPLSHPSNSLSEHLIQALLFFFIGIPVLHLPPRYVPNLSIGTLHTSILVITLSIATLLALISPFLPTVTPLLYIPPSLFLLYTIQAIPRIAYILHIFLHPEDSIQIQFQLHNTTGTIPLTLPSPASTPSFPISTDEIHDIRNHHHKIPSVSTTSTITIVDRTRISFPPRLHSPSSQQEQEPNDRLRSQILNSRSRSLLVFIFAGQVASLAASACALGVTIAASNNATTLKTVQTACTVLALTGSMSAYLLHTYNLHLRQTPITTPLSDYNNLSTHSSDQLQMIESQHHPNSRSPMLLHLAPPLPKARRICANAGVSMGRNALSRLNDEGATTTDSDSEEIGLELDVVMDISRYSMALDRGLGATTGLGSGKKDSIDLGLALMSSPVCTPVPVPLPVPLPLMVSVDEGSRYEGIENGGGGGGGYGISASALEKLKEREKEKIQGYYLCSSSSVSTGSPSSPFSPFGMETEMDRSSPDTPYPNLHLHPNTSGGSPDAHSDAINANANANANAVDNTDTIAYTHAQVRKRGSFFGWEFAWDQEALERADDGGKLRSVAGGGGSPARWESGVNLNAQLNTNALNPTTSDEAYTSKKVQPFLIVDHEDQRDGRGSFGPSQPLSRPQSLSSEADVGGGRMKRGTSWRSSVCGIAGAGVGGEKVKRKNTLGLGIGMKPLRLSRSFGGSGNNSGDRGNAAGNGRRTGHRTVLSGDTGLMCGLSLKRKATVLAGGQGSPVSPVSGSTHVMGQGQGKGDATVMMVAAAAATPKRLKKKPKPEDSTAVAGSSPSAESDMGKRNNKGNHSNTFIPGNRNLESDDDELDEGANLQKTPRMTSRVTARSYPHSPQSYRHSSSSSPPPQQSHEAATSESRCSSINESCITTTATTATANTNPPPSLTRRGLSLKRSFKMGSTVGRTLGPGLTLSSAGSGSGTPSTSVWPCAHKSIRRCESEGFGFREAEKRECEGKKRVVYGGKNGKENLNDEKEKVEEEGGEEVEVDVETKMESPVAARLVSPSYARATPAAGAGANPSPSSPSRSGRSGSPINYMTMPKSMLHSRPSLPIMNARVSASESSCLTITQQYQQEHRYQHPQNVYNSSLSTAASRGYGGHSWEPHPFVDWVRSSEAENTRDDDVVEPEIGRGSRGNDNDKLSSLSLLPPLSPLLSPMTHPPQSKSLPPTPTKSRSTLLTRSSISSFKKRSVPPALPSTSMVSSAYSKSHAISQSAVVGARQGQGQGQTISRPPSQPLSRPTMSRPSTRLSAMSMGTVKNAFAGVGAKVSARMSINSMSTRGSAGAASGNTMASSMGRGVDDIDGDFMDLRDPFASPPPSKLASVFMGGDHTRGGAGDFWVSGRAMSSLGGATGAGMTVYDDDDDVEVEITRRISSVSGGKRNMNAWGKLPMPSISPPPGSTPGRSSPSVSSLVASGKRAHCHHGERRKHKEKRARKAAGLAAGNGVLNETNSSLQGSGGPSSPYHAGEEDTDFGVEEALLSQRLLRRLDSVERV